MGIKNISSLGKKILNNYPFGDIDPHKVGNTRTHTHTKSLLQINACAYDECDIIASAHAACLKDTSGSRLYVNL